jgi:hypothetical protein
MEQIFETADRTEIEFTAPVGTEHQVRELSDLQLAFVGGGIADLVAA